jgi:hypothetical protein
MIKHRSTFLTIATILGLITVFGMRGHSVLVPGLPGCWSQGITEEERVAA